MQADDGYSRSAPIKLNIKVSSAKLVLINIERIQSLALGQNKRLHITGDFEDQAGVSLPSDYLHFVSDNENILSVDAQGNLHAKGEGIAHVKVQARGIEGVNAISVGVEEGGYGGIELDVYPLTIALPVSGQRQLKVSEADGSRIDASVKGTTYHISDRSLADISADGLITAKRAGKAKVSVINKGRQYDLILDIQEPVIGRAVIHDKQGVVVQDEHGNQLMVAAGSLKAGTEVGIKQIGLDEVGMPLPAPGVITTLNAFTVDIGQNKAGLPLQLAVKVPNKAVNAKTGREEVLKAGTEVMFWKKGTIRDTDGTEHDTWWLVDNGYIGKDGVARTASPPYKGSYYSGTYAVTYTQTAEQEQTGAMDIVTIDMAAYWDALWAIQAAISFAPHPMMAASALGIFAATAMPVALIKKTVVGSFKKYIAPENLTAANITTAFPAPPDALNAIPAVTRMAFDVQTRKLTLNGLFVPEGQSRLNFDFKVWLQPRGSQITAPDETGSKPQRGLVWQGYQADVSVSGNELEVVLPDGIALSQHVVTVQRTAKNSKDGGEERLYSLPTESNPIQAWSLGTDNILLTHRNEIVVMHPAARKAGAPSSGSTKEIDILPIVARVSKDENGDPLDFLGGREDQIAFTNDGTLAFIGARDGKIHVFDNQTLKIVHTIQTPNSRSNIVSMAVSGQWLYVAQSASGRENRLLRINIDQMSPDFLEQIQVITTPVSLEGENLFGMALNNDSYLALTAPKGSRFARSQESGKVFVLDINKIDENGILDKGAMFALGEAELGTGQGRYAGYISSGKNNGEFLLSSMHDQDKGFSTLRVQVDKTGSLTGSIDRNAFNLSNRKKDPLWSHRTMQTALQNASGNVLAEYEGVEYAIVGDHFIEHFHPLWNWESGYLAGKQAGGKLGVIRDPFNKQGKMKFLGTSTPIPYGMIGNLSLSRSGWLLADVTMSYPILSQHLGRVTKTLFAWDAAGVIAAALDAENDGGHPDYLPFDYKPGRTGLSPPPPDSRRSCCRR